MSIGLTPPLASAPREALQGCSDIKAEAMRERRDWDETETGLSRQSQSETGWKNTSLGAYITQARFTVGPTWSLSLGREIYAVVCWFHSSGLQLLAACRAFIVAGLKVWNVLPEGTSAQSLTIFFVNVKNLAFHTAIYADIIWTVIPLTTY